MFVNSLSSQTPHGPAKAILGHITHLLIKVIKGVGRLVAQSFREEERKRSGRQTSSSEHKVGGS